MAWWTDQRLHPKAKNKFIVVFGNDFFIPSVKTIGKPKIDFETKEFKLLNHKFNYPGNGTWQPIEMKFVDMNGLGDTDDTFDTSAFLWQILNNTGYAYPYLDDSSDVSNNPYYKNVVNQKVGANGGHHIATKISYDRDNPDTEENEKRTSYRTITTPEKSSTIANAFGKGLGGFIDNEKAHYSRQKISIYQLSPESQSTGKNPVGAKIVECWHLVNPIIKSITWGDLSYDTDDLVEYSLNIIYDWAIYDRNVIGSAFAPDATSYQQFMKNYALAQQTIEQEQIRQQFEALEDLGQLDEFDLDNNGTISANEAFRAQQDALLREGNFIDGAFDADGDGVISESERLFSENNREQIEKKLTETEILNEQAERRQLTLQAEAAKEKIEKRKAEEERLAEEQAQKEESVDDFLDAVDFGSTSTNIGSDAQEAFDSLQIDNSSTDAGNNLSASGTGVGAGWTTDDLGDVTDGLTELDVFLGETVNNDNIRSDNSFPFNPLSDLTETEPREANLDYETENSGAPTEVDVPFNPLNNLAEPEVVDSESAFNEDFAGTPSDPLGSVISEDEPNPFSRTTPLGSTEEEQD